MLIFKFLDSNLKSYTGKLRRTITEAALHSVKSGRHPRYVLESRVRLLFKT